MTGKLLLSLSMALAFASACTSGGTSDSECDPACTGGKVCDTKLKICKPPVPDGGETNAGDMTGAEAVWPKTGMFFTQKYWLLDNPDTDVNFTGTVAVDKDNSSILTGGFKGSFDASNAKTGNLTSAGDRDIYIAKYDAGMKFLWAKSFGGTGVDFATSVITDNQNNIYVAGFASKTTNLGDAKGKDSVFVAKFDGNGATKWVKLFGTPTRKNQATGTFDPTYTESKPAIATDGTNIYVLSGYGGSIDLSGNGTFLDGDGDAPVVYAAFSAADGAHVWSKRLGDFKNGRYLSIAADSQGVTLAGDLYSASTLNLGGGVLSAATNGMFIGRVSAAGAFVWNKSYASAETRALAADGNGGVLAVGRLPVAVTFGGTTLTPMANTDRNGFLVKFDKTGAVGITRAYQSTAYATMRAVASSRDGSDYAVTGDFRTDANLGGSKRMFGETAIVGRYKVDGTWVNDGYLSTVLGRTYGDGIAAAPDGTFTVLLSVDTGVLANNAVLIQRLGLFKINIQPGN